MQPEKANQVFVFEDDGDIVEDPDPQELQLPEKPQKTQVNQAGSGANKEADHSDYHEQIVSPNFNSLPPHLKAQQNNTTQQPPLQQKSQKAPDLVFLEQNAYSFRKDELGAKTKNEVKQFENELDIISDFNSEMSKNQGLIQGNDQVTSGVSRNRNEKSRRSRKKSRFQDINDENSVKSNSKLGLYDEPAKIVPNLLNQQAHKQNQQDYHKTQDHLRHDKNNHEEIVQSINGISPTRKREKALPPINSHKPGQIFINTSGILQNQTSMAALKPKQDFAKLSMTNMSSLSQMLHENDKIKKISDKVVPRGKTFKCHLQREKVCGLSFWHPIYSFFYKNEKLILNAKKQCGRINSLYNITSQQKCFDKSSDNYSGYLAGNFAGSIFNLYQKVDDSQQLVCTIVYDIECSCSSSIRKVQIYIKNEIFSSQSLFKNNNQRDCNLKQLYYLGQNAKQKKILKIVNKKPEWNEQSGCYSMNFKGKCKMASVKNAIYISQEEPNRYVLLFCKTEQNNFYAQISYPLSPFVAMGIILSSFDFKLLCQ